MERDHNYESTFKDVEPYESEQYSRFKKISSKSIKPKAGNNFWLGRINFVELIHLILSHLVRISWMLNS